VDLFIPQRVAENHAQAQVFPVIAEHTMSYKKSLHLFEHYTAELELTHWDDKFFT